MTSYISSFRLADILPSRRVFVYAIGGNQTTGGHFQ